MREQEMEAGDWIRMDRMDMDGSLEYSSTHPIIFYNTNEG